MKQYKFPTDPPTIITGSLLADERGPKHTLQIVANEEGRCLVVCSVDADPQDTSSTNQIFFAHSYDSLKDMILMLLIYRHQSEDKPEQVPLCNLIKQLDLTEINKRYTERC